MDNIIWIGSYPTGRSKDPNGDQSTNIFARISRPSLNASLSPARWSCTAEQNRCSSLRPPCHVPSSQTQKLSLCLSPTPTFKCGLLRPAPSMSLCTLRRRCVGAYDNSRSNRHYKVRAIDVRVIDTVGARKSIIASASRHMECGVIPSVPREQQRVCLRVRTRR